MRPCVFLRPAPLQQPGIGKGAVRQMKTRIRVLAPPKSMCSIIDATWREQRHMLSWCFYSEHRVPFEDHLIASSKRSSPQKTSPFITKLGDPNTPNFFASVVTSLKPVAMPLDAASPKIRFTSCPISLRLSEMLGSSPAGKPSSYQRL